ncbi:MAG TPA: zf-HC2 domain-containing protein [Longimicrobiales bacterium]|jgi:anti-sigma factor (TIGR02949 family)|nr:zf-HC2 domain-containing protein [Longimicrobiales bacterium]
MIFDAFRKWLGRRGDGPGEAGSPEAIPCHDALSRLYELLDGELDDRTAGQVAAHLEACRRCYPHLASERAFKAALRRALEGRKAPRELRRRVLRLLDEAVEGG